MNTRWKYRKKYVETRRRTALMPNMATAAMSRAKAAVAIFAAVVMELLHCDVVRSLKTMALQPTLVQLFCSPTTAILRSTETASHRSKVRTAIRTPTINKNQRHSASRESCIR